MHWKWQYSTVSSMYKCIINDKMAREKTNTQNDTKTRTTTYHNRHLEKLYFCDFRIFIFFIFFFIYNFLNEFSKKYWVTALVRLMTFVGILNQF